MMYISTFSDIGCIITKKLYFVNYQLVEIKLQRKEK